MPNLAIENIGSWTSNIGQSKIEDVSTSKISDVASTQSTSDSSSADSSFAQMLKEGMQHVNETQSDADHAVKELLAGRSKNIHETMLLMEKADMTFKMAMQVRNKIIDAYREVMKMQV